MRTVAVAVVGTGGIAGFHAADIARLGGSSGPACSRACARHPFFDTELPVAPAATVARRYAVTVADGDAGPDGSFPDATAQSRLRVYDWPAADGIPVVMQNAGLPEAGDVVLTFRRPS